MRVANMSDIVYIPGDSVISGADDHDGAQIGMNFECAGHTFRGDNVKGLVVQVPVK